MSQDQAIPDEVKLRSATKRLPASHYITLGLTPTASPQEIRRAYRELSKQYHPDTTTLPAAIAISKFQQLNEAYAVLNNFETRAIYDQKIGVKLVRPPLNLGTQSVVRSVTPSRVIKSSGYLDPVERPLSPGEIFALFILGLTLVACLVLAIAIGLTREPVLFTPLALFLL